MWSLSSDKYNGRKEGSDEIDLTVTFVYRVEAYHLAVGTPPGMEVATAVDGTVDRRDIELSDLPYLLVGKANDLPCAVKIAHAVCDFTAGNSCKKKKKLRLTSCFFELVLYQNFSESALASGRKCKPLLKPFAISPIILGQRTSPVAFTKGQALKK